jgi:hypothetical protein
MMKRSLFATLLCLVVFPGCLVSGKINAAGAGTVTIRSRLTTPNQLDATAKQMVSTSVRLVSAKADADKWATFELAFDDVSKLSTTEVFENATFTLSDGEGGLKTFSVRYANKKPARLSDELLNYYGREATFRIELPGEVVDSNATSVDGQTAAWTYPLEKLTSGPILELQATFRTVPPTVASDPPAEK